MKKVKFLNWLLVLFVVFTSFNLASCSDDDNYVGDGEGNELPGDNPNPAGDDFYAYVNGAWHKTLEETGETQGYVYDIAQVLADKTAECADNMPELPFVLEAFEKYSAEENEARLDEIISDIIDDIETEEDAYLAIGECVKMGLIDDYIRLYMTPRGSEVGFTLVPKSQADEMDMNDVEEEEDDDEMSPEDEVVEIIIEGMGLSADNYVDTGAIDEFIAGLMDSSVDEMKEFLQETIADGLLPYCENKASAASYFDEEIPNLLPYSLSRAFCEMYVTPEMKAQFQAYLEELTDAFAKRVENNTWLSTATKQQALTKLDNMQFCLGGADEWNDDFVADVKGELLLDDIVEMKSNRSRIIEATLGKSVRDESITLLLFAPGGMPLNVNNSVYDVENNTVTIFPVYMMEPEYSITMDPGKMYALFYVFGHEITHGFDIEGAQYDSWGNEADWWTAEDRAKFEALNAQFSEQIGTHEVAPGIYAPAENTITEDVADLGGLNIAFDALNAYLAKEGITGEEMKNQQRLFFEHYATRYRVKYTDEAFQSALNDIHSVATVRVNALLQHMDAWYDLYNVKEGDALYLPADKRITIW